MALESPMGTSPAKERHSVMNQERVKRHKQSEQRPFGLQPVVFIF